MTVLQATETDTASRWLSQRELDHLIQILRDDGMQVIAPRVEQNAIILGEIESTSQLPIGWTDRQSPGNYRIEKRGDERCFEFNVGPQSWKQYLFPPRLKIQEATRDQGDWKFSSPPPSTQPRAFLGVRACELAAIRMQDRIMMSGTYIDREYAARRNATFIIAVNCTVASSTCFCTSTDTGPRCEQGFDLALTETSDGFVMEIGSDAGAAISERLETGDVPDSVASEASHLRQRARDQISKHLETDGIRERLLDNLDHPHWDDVATRCLSCANCTMVCPTCFCSTVEEVTDLHGDQIDRVRSWDSCFNLEFGYTAAGTARNSIRNRYRQWLTHKLATWHDQFESSGCVGCGRCVTWCPVGIDLTEEVVEISKPVDRRRTVPPKRPPAEACAVPAPDSSSNVPANPGDPTRAQSPTGERSDRHDD